MASSEALANELAAKFWLEKGKEDIARLYMTKAHRCYESWGAETKAEDVKKRYPHLLETKPKKMTGTTAETALELLDLSTLMKATNSISSEIEMDKLLGKVMNVVIENAGAQTGFILLERDGIWQIAAKVGIKLES